jgi:hypothetical protein
VLLLLLMGLVIFNDLNKEYTRWGAPREQQQQQPAANTSAPAGTPATQK